MIRLIATTSAHAIKPLGFQGQLVVDAWPALRKLLEARLGLIYGTLLAEPVPDQGRGDIDWYGDVVEGDAAADAQTRTVCLEMTARCGELARSLAGSADAVERLHGELLARALIYPDESFIRRGVAGPVIIAWGHERAGARAAEADLSGKRAVPAPPGPVLAQADPSLQPIIRPLADPLPPALPVPAQPRDERAWATHLGLPLLALLLVAVAWLAPRWLAAGCQRPWWPLALLVLLLFLCQIVLSRKNWFQKGWVWRLQARRDFLLARRHRVGAGAMQVVLAWDDLNDLDLHVICPDGGHISFERPLMSGGRLDRDANALRPGAPPPSARPIENVFWSAPPQPGCYLLLVDPYDMRASPRSAFRVNVRLGRQTLLVARGTAQAGERMQPACEFSVPPRAA